MDCVEQINKVFMAGFDFGFAMLATGAFGGLVLGYLLGRVHSWSKQP